MYRVIPIILLCSVSDADTEWWQTYTLKHEIGGGKLMLEYVNKKDQDITNTFQTENTVGYEFPVFGLKLSVNYRYLDTDSGIENRYFMDVSKEKKCGLLNLKLRLRGEVRDRDDITYRVRPMVEVGYGKSYVFNELFYDFEDITRDRVGCGYRFPLMDHVELNVGYMSEFNGPDWDRDNVVFSKVLIEF